jgi:hypothetical protein
MGSQGRILLFGIAMKIMPLRKPAPGLHQIPDPRPGAKVCGNIPEK